jgi:hypothetical protein
MKTHSEPKSTRDSVHERHLKAGGDEIKSSAFSGPRVVSHFWQDSPVELTLRHECDQPVAAAVPVKGSGDDEAVPLVSFRYPPVERLVRTTYWLLMTIAILFPLICLFLDPLFEFPMRSAAAEAVGVRVGGCAAVMLLPVSFWIRRWAWDAYSVGVWVGGLGIGLFFIRTHSF